MTGREAKENILFFLAQLLLYGTPMFSASLFHLKEKSCPQKFIKKKKRIDEKRTKNLAFHRRKNQSQRIYQRYLSEFSNL